LRRARERDFALTKPAGAFGADGRDSPFWLAAGPGRTPHGHPPAGGDIFAGNHGVTLRQGVRRSRLSVTAQDGWKTSLAGGGCHQPDLRCNDLGLKIFDTGAEVPTVTFQPSRRWMSATLAATIG